MLASGSLGTVLAACSACSLTEVELLSYMENQGLQPDSFTFLSLLISCDKKARPDEAETLMDDLLTRGLVVPPGAFRALLHATDESKGPWATLNIIQKYRMHGLCPDAKALAGLQSSWTHRHSPDVVLALAEVIAEADM